MASTYNIEPPPTAKVLLTTTSGDLLLELFAKQTPLASRNFLQHCLDGYYDGTIFHRLVPGFILQGGDPSGTGEGGESIYDQTGEVVKESGRGGVGFENEFHSRLKWNRRGLLGMANEDRPNTNGSQFFLSLGEDCRQLEGRNTMFGRVVGDTVFNLLKMGDAEVKEGSERPLYPTRVTGCEVLVNPFEGMGRREVRRVEGVKEEKGAREVRKGKKKGGKQLLSFGGEEGEGEEGPVVKKQKFNPKLVDGKETSKEGVKNGVASETNGHTKAAAKKHETARRRQSSASASPPPMKKQKPEAQLPLPQDEEPSRSGSSSPEPVERMSSLLAKTNAQIEEMKASMKRTIQPAPAKDDKPKSALEQLMPATAVRGKKIKQGKKGEKQTLDLLSAFKSKLASAEAETDVAEVNGQDTKGKTNGKASEENDEEAALCDLHFIANCESCRSWDEQANGKEEADEVGTGWMSHALSFEKDRRGKDLTFKRKAEEELVVIDPREKSKDIKADQIARKKERTGGSRAWDADRRR